MPGACRPSGASQATGHIQLAGDFVASMLVPHIFSSTPPRPEIDDNSIGQ